MKIIKISDFYAGSRARVKFQPIQVFGDEFNGRLTKMEI
jgi:hypothetical protein